MFVIALLLNIPIPAKKILVGRAYIELKCNDNIIFFTNKGEFVYKIKKIFGFRGVEYNVTKPGFNYEFLVEGDIEKLEGYDILYQYKNEENTDCRLPEKALFDIDKDKELEIQTYEIILYMKPKKQNYNVTLKQFKGFLDILSKKSYVFYDKYSENNNSILDNCKLNDLLEKYKQSNSEWIDRGYKLGLYTSNKDFVVVNLGSSNRNVLNRVRITFTEECDFISQDRNDFFISILKDLIRFFSPSLAFLCSSSNRSRFEKESQRSLIYAGVILPTAIFNINYYSKELTQKNCEFDFKKAKELSEEFHDGYLLKVKNIVLDNNSKEDLLLQKKYDELLNANLIRMGLQKNCFLNKEDLLKYM